MHLTYTSEFDGIAVVTCGMYPTYEVTLGGFCKLNDIQLETEKSSTPLNTFKFRIQKGDVVDAYVTPTYSTGSYWAGSMYLTIFGDSTASSVVDVQYIGNGASFTSKIGEYYLIDIVTSTGVTPSISGATVINQIFQTENFTWSTWISVVKATEETITCTNGTTYNRNYHIVL